MAEVAESSLLKIIVPALGSVALPVFSTSVPLPRLVRFAPSKKVTVFGSVADAVPVRLKSSVAPPLTVIVDPLTLAS